MLLQLVVALGAVACAAHTHSTGLQYQARHQHQARNATPSARVRSLDLPRERAASHMHQPTNSAISDSEVKTNALAFAPSIREHRERAASRAPTLAICMVGAVRSLAASGVLHRFQTHVVQAAAASRSDIFAVLPNSSDAEVRKAQELLHPVVTLGFRSSDCSNPVLRDL